MSLILLKNTIFFSYRKKLARQKKKEKESHSQKSHSTKKKRKKDKHPRHKDKDKDKVSSDFSEDSEDNSEQSSKLMLPLKEIYIDIQQLLLMRGVNRGMEIRRSELFFRPNPSIHRYFRSNPDPHYVKK